MRAGEAAQAAALANMKPGMTELDAYLLVQNAAIQHLGERAIVYGDFASAPRTATDKGGFATSAIEPGDLLLLDFSVVVDGYRSDFTNTFAVGGGPTPRQHELFDACLGALKVGEALLKAGTIARDVDAAVKDHFRSLGLLGLFPHHTGHGIGLGHPEPPYFVPGSDEVLVEDVVIVEPGFLRGGRRRDADRAELLVRSRPGDSSPSRITRSGSGPDRGRRRPGGGKFRPSGRGGRPRESPSFRAGDDSTSRWRHSRT